MPSIRLPYTDPFGTGARPYLTLLLAGPSGELLEVIGLLDTGADMSVLPANDAARMGYTAGMLEDMPIDTADGPGLGLRPTEPSTATALVPGVPSMPIALDPIIVPGANTPLWGRKDVMRPFEVLVNEAEQFFSFSW